MVTRSIILGAGASKSYEQSPTRQRMPVADDFFLTFDRLGIASHPWVLRGKTIVYLRDNHGINPNDAFKRPLNIEAIFSEVSDSLFQIPAGKSFDRALLHGVYTELIFLFAATVNSIASGPLSRPHLELAAWLTPNDTVITFNWDVLMDRALQHECNWHVDDGYGLSPTAIFRDGWQNAREQKVRPAPMMLKLHGSANWLTAVQMYEQDSYVFTHTLPPESVFVFEFATSPYACFAGRYMPGYEPLTFGYYPPNLNVEGRSAPEGHAFASFRQKYPWTIEGTAPEDGVISIPLIIPPEKTKQYGWYGGLFGNLWANAQEALRTCDEIVIIGYSFPSTDTRSRTLFRDAFLGRNTIPSVKLIDPSPFRAIQVLTQDLGIPQSHLVVHAVPFTGMASIL